MSLVIFSETRSKSHAWYMPDCGSWPCWVQGQVSWPCEIHATDGHSPWLHKAWGWNKSTAITVTNKHAWRLGTSWLRSTGSTLGRKGLTLVRTVCSYVLTTHRACSDWVALPYSVLQSPVTTQLVHMPSPTPSFLLLSARLGRVQLPTSFHLWWLWLTPVPTSGCYVCLFYMHD